MFLKTVWGNSNSSIHDEFELVAVLQNVIWLNRITINRRRGTRALP